MGAERQAEKVPEKQTHIAHLLLAAGASTRMGRPKQLLPWKGENLIRYAVHQILKAGISEKIVVVLGADQERIASALEGLPVERITNPNWAEGMGSTIRCGMEYIVSGDFRGWDGVMISLVDQPFVQAAHFQKLFEGRQQQGRPITAARYKEILGVPAVFDQSQFPLLLGLSGQAGARQVLQSAGDLVWPVDVPEAALDLDTPEDYDRWRAAAGG